MKQCIGEYIPIKTFLSKDSFIVTFSAVLKLNFY